MTNTYPPCFSAWISESSDKVCAVLVEPTDATTVVNPISFVKSFMEPRTSFIARRREHLVDTRIRFLRLKTIESEVRGHDCGVPMHVMHRVSPTLAFARRRISF